MLRIKEEISIDRNPDELFDFVADLNNFPLWRANLVSSKIVTSGPTDVGTKCEEVMQIGPIRPDVSCTITQFSPGKTLAFQALSPGIIYDGTLIVAGDEGGSKFTIKAEASPTGFMKLIFPIMQGNIAKGVRSEVEAVKRNMENS